MKKIFKIFLCIMLCIITTASFTLQDQVTVEAATTVKINKSKLTLEKGKSYTLKITGTTKKVKWASSNKKVATVSTKGKVTAVSKGTATITATVSNKKYTCKVTVKAPALSKDWKDFELLIDNQLYELLFDYKKLQDAGWDFSTADYGIETLKADYKTYGIIELVNSKYDSKVIVGIQNTTTTTQDIKKCKVWSIKIDNTYAENPVSFTLPGGIKQGSTVDDVVKAYGEPSDTYRSDDLGYWVYTYEVDYSDSLKLTIYDDGGLVNLSYELYK